MRKKEEDQEGFKRPKGNLIVPCENVGHYDFNKEQELTPNKDVHSV